MIFKKTVLILGVLLLLMPLFAQEEKSTESKGPSVLIMVVYRDNVQSLLNVTYNRDVKPDFLNLKINELKAVYGGDLEVIPNEDGNARGITAFVKNCSYVVGSGEALQPFEDVFYDENKVTVLFTGDFIPLKNSLMYYTKDDFELRANVHENALLDNSLANIQYEFANNHQIVNLPHDQRSVNVGRVLKTLGIWALYIIGAIIFIWLVVVLFRRSVKIEKKKRGQKKQ